MGYYLLRRLLLVIPTLFGIMLINFAVIQIVPGGPVEQMIAQMTGTAIESTARFSGNSEGEVGQNLDIDNLRLKVPNDIMLEGKKVCGILIENILDNPNYFYSTIGIGLNLSIPNRLLNIIDGNPGNLKINPSQVGVLLRNIIKSISRNISILKDKGPNSFVESINNYKFI